MVKNLIKAVIWDLDGTLIDFKIDFLRARKEAFTILKNYGIPDDILSLETGIVDTMQKAKKMFRSRGMKENEIELIIKEVDQKVIAIEQEAAIKASMIKGIDEVLKYIKRQQLKQAIYTYNHTINAKISLEKVQLLHFFDIIAGRDSIDNPKPHPEHLNYICNQLNVKATQIIVIGDHFRDIQGAQKVGAHSIAIHSKMAKVDSLNIADVIIEEKDIPSKLIQAIENLI
ncbi:MAG: HAD family hydrolase [Promethearchaeota archaeon]